MKKIKYTNYIKEEKKVNTPWYQYYGDKTKKHLDYPLCSIYEFLYSSNESRKDYIAYNYFGKKGTFEHLFNMIDDVAKSLKTINVKEKDRVTICMPNTPEAVASFYAINKIGAVASMIHPLSAENEIKYYLNVAKSKVIISVDFDWEKIEKILPETKVEKVILLSVKESMPVVTKTGYTILKEKKIETHHDKVIFWHDFIKRGSSYDKKIEVKVNPNEEAVLLYSGGTSGSPKGIRLSNLNMNAVAVQGVEACGVLNEKDKVLAIMPIFHGFGLGICIHTCLCLGGTSVILPQFSAKTFDQLLKKYKPNVLAGVPTLYEAFINNKKIQKMNLSYLKCVISGGDSLSVSLKKKIDDFLKAHKAECQVREGYGLTECVTGSCLTPEDFYREGSIGIPYPDTYYKIVIPNTTEEAPIGEEGEIALSGPTVMLGYLNNKEETKKTLRKHKDGLTWLHTGDLGFMDQDGFVYFKQRLKRMIISSGYNVYPQQIENVIDSYPDVFMSCVVSKKHPYKKEVAKAFVVLKEGVAQTEETKEKILKHCAKNLAKYSIPAEIEFKESLPKTLVGKVAYTVLQAECDDEYEIEHPEEYKEYKTDQEARSKKSESIKSFIKKQKEELENFRQNEKALKKAAKKSKKEKKK